MDTTTTSPATNFEDVYLAARAKGEPHSEAVRRAMHAFGGGRREHELGDRIARVRRQWEDEHGEDRQALRVGDDLDVIEKAEPIVADEFSPVEAELRERVAELTAERQRLSLSAVTGDAKAKTKLSSVSASLADAEVELEHVGLARAEARRREEADRREAERQEREDALKLADELGAERAIAAKAADDAALQFGAALAQLADVCGRQGHALVRAGRIENASRNLPSDGDLEGMFAHALMTTGAPSGWANLDVLPRFQHPLT